MTAIRVKQDLVQKKVSLSSTKESTICASVLVVLEATIAKLVSRIHLRNFFSVQINNNWVFTILN